MKVLDASAILTYLYNEPGREQVKAALSEGASCSTANWSEVMQKVLHHGHDWSAMRQLLLGHDLAIEPVTAVDAEWAARHWLDHQNLALGDRLCLALAHRLQAVALTADSAWGSEELIQQVR